MLGMIMIVAYPGGGVITFLYISQRGGHHFFSFDKGGSCVFVRCFAGSYGPPSGKNNERSLIPLLFQRSLLWNLQYYIKIWLFGVKGKTLFGSVMNLQNIDLLACHLKKTSASCLLAFYLFCCLGWGITVGRVSCRYGYITLLYRH